MVTDGGYTSYLCPPTLIFLDAKSTFLQSNVLIKMVKSSCKLWAYLTHLFPYEKIASSRKKNRCSDWREEKKSVKSVKSVNRTIVPDICIKGLF